MNNRICDYVSTWTEPDFFNHSDADLSGIQEEIRTEIENAEDVMTINIDKDLMKREKKKLAKIGWTLEEAAILYLYWCVTCPESARAWNQKAGNGEVKASAWRA